MRIRGGSSLVEEEKVRGESYKGWGAGEIGGNFTRILTISQ